ncbi:hypothetical protein [Maricaulis virginensis]|uniref:HEPN domain-containing protein n=1 Tax=Maricaulis virginensis TaxID=144022 RepID=A0A9W6MP31_9PROT|nr:hypothetical protein [Maricaulis virginensis]GLK53215.1 hypothetical protein GCM10017621_27230 [Maricaulis virginensis]
MPVRDPYHHQLFWEGDKEFQREDEWSFPKCFAFGDMDVLEEHNLGVISDNYFRCAEALIEHIYRGDIEDFVAQFPIIYLFRHAFEVKLKEIINTQTGKSVEHDHSLHGLMNKIEGLETWARKRLLELHEIDPRSTMLRYGGIGTKARNFLGTDARFFHEAMRALRDYLSAFAAAEVRRSAA